MNRFDLIVDTLIEEEGLPLKYMFGKQKDFLNSDKLENFISFHINRLEESQGFENIQRALNDFSDPNNPFVNYFTTLIFTSIESQFVNPDKNSNDILEIKDRIKVISWIANVILGTLLNNKGYKGISQEQGIFRFYSKATMNQVIQIMSTSIPVHLLNGTIEEFEDYIQNDRIKNGLFLP